MSLDPVAAQETHRYGEHPDQVLDFWHPDEPSDRLVILLHGGFWRQEYDRTPLPRSAIAAVVAIAPVSDLAGARAQGLGNGAVADFLGPADPPGTDPALLPIGVPTTLIHGRRDIWVPFEMSQRFVAAADGKARLIALDVGHYEPIDAAEPAAKTTMQTVLG